jgi:hypothetical protein
MAYCIFLKFLRILEEFRKIPPIKIPPKSPLVQIPKVQPNSKIHWEFENHYCYKSSLEIWPDRPRPRRTILSCTVGHSLPNRPARPMSHWRILTNMFSLRVCVICLSACVFSLTDRWAPLVRVIPFLPAPLPQRTAFGRPVP